MCVCVFTCDGVIEQGYMRLILQRRIVGLLRLENKLTLLTSLTGLSHFVSVVAHIYYFCYTIFVEYIFFVP